MADPHAESGLNSEHGDGARRTKTRKGEALRRTHPPPPLYYRHCEILSESPTGEKFNKLFQIKQIIRIMKRYTINCHYDMVISVDVIADNEQQAIERAKFKAEDIDLKEAECYDQSQCVADVEELTAGELRTMEREAVSEFVPWLLTNETPTEWHYYANGGAFDWTCYESEDTTDWERQLFASIANGTHKDTALFNRYARLLSRQRWQEHADTLCRLWDAAWQQARQNPETYRVIVETNEADPTAPENEFGRYYMVDGSENESCIEHAGQWVVIRVDTVTSPYEVRRPNWANTHGYADSWTQLACRCENPNNVTRWARLMIDAGRVTDIYADCY